MLVKCDIRAGRSESKILCGSVARARAVFLKGFILYCLRGDVMMRFCDSFLLF